MTRSNFPGNKGSSAVSDLRYVLLQTLNIFSGKKVDNSRDSLYRPTEPGWQLSGINFAVLRLIGCPEVSRGVPSSQLSTEAAPTAPRAQVNTSQQVCK